MSFKQNYCFFSLFFILLGGVFFAADIESSSIVKPSTVELPDSLVTKPVTDTVLKAINTTTVEEAEKIITDALKTELPDAEKLESLTFLASLQEQLGKYQNAKTNYSLASNLSAKMNQVAGKSARANENLLLGAVRCALSTGDIISADYILSTAFISNITTETKAYIRLYAVWSWLCKIQNKSEIASPINILSSFLSLNSMNTVKPAVLLTLWYITGEQKYADILANDYSDSPEYSIVKGESNIMPAPFWYFVPAVYNDSNKFVDDKSPTEDIKKTTKENNIKKEEAQLVDKVTEKQISETIEIVLEPGEKAKENTEINLVKFYQLGFFRDIENAQKLFERVKAKGFAVELRQEKRGSGTVYYAVVVKENATGTMGMLLKKSGFESYPVF